MSLGTDLRTTAKILVVDPDHDFLMLSKAWLEKAGHLVAIASDPLAAHDLWVAQPSEVLLVEADIERPGGGIRLANALTQLRPELAVVVMTGALGEEVPSRYGVLTKPFNRRCLLDAIERAIKECMPRSS